MAKDESKTVGQLNGAWALMFKTCIIIFLPFSGWMSLAVLANQNDIIEIKANRFTANDGQEVWKELAQKYDKRIDHIPPDWFKQDVQEIKDELKVLNTRLLNIEMMVHTGVTP